MLNEAQVRTTFPEVLMSKSITHIAYNKRYTRAERIKAIAEAKKTTSYAAGKRLGISSKTINEWIVKDSKGLL